MERNDFIEKIIGGIFALIAIIAAAAEMIIGGFSVEAIVGGIKDIFGTLVVVVLFFTVVQEIVPKVKFEDRLSAAINEWQKENSNMVIRDPASDIEHLGQAPSCFSLNLKTDVADFYKGVATTKKKGLFVRMPLLTKENFSKEQIILTFYLNKGTFFSHLPKGEDTQDKYDKLTELFTALIQDKHSAFASAAGNGKEIVVTLKKPIRTNSDIKELVAIMNTMYTAYLVAANLGK